MLSQDAITCYFITNNIRLLIPYSGHPEGEGMKVGFDGGIRLEFHGAKVTSDGGLLAYRDLDNALWITRLRFYRF